MLIGNELNGASYYSLLLGGYEYLYAKQEYVDALNVFPVPDGDTGKNMVASLKKGIAETKPTESISEVAQDFSRRCLFAARGNSGVILSQFFNGISKGLQSLNNPITVTAETFARTLQKGYEQALSSVSKPVEGTILTVLRESTEYLLQNVNKETTLSQLLGILVYKARESLENTPNLLPVLQEAGVVDSGGAGMLYIFEGMQMRAEGKDIEVGEVSVEAEHTETKVGGGLPFPAYTMHYGYCTEFILQLTNRANVPVFDKEAFVAYLQTIGDSIVAVEDGDIVKVHVHTFTPEKVFAYAHDYGEFLTVKVENMDVQNLSEAKQALVKAAKKHQKFAVVAVASGSGISQYFLEIGASYILNAGQTQNPSAEDFVEAFKQLDAENIIVLPNNKNIILAAKQAKELYKDAEVFVLETTSIPEGYSALSMMDTTAQDVDSFLCAMQSNLENVTTASVATANRTLTMNNVEIQEGDCIAIVDGEVTCSNRDKNGAVLSLLENLGDIDEKETIIVFVGADVTEEERSALEEALLDAYPLYDIAFIEGNQTVYSYILSIE